MPVVCVAFSEVVKLFFFQEALIRNLIDWVQIAPNPLQSYAAGLLASAMEIQDLAAVFKDSNATLVIVIRCQLVPLC